MQSQQLEHSDARTDDACWAETEMVRPKKKIPVHIRLNPDVLDYFKSQGDGYQSRINHVLERYVEYQRSKTEQS